MALATEHDQTFDQLRRRQHPVRRLLDASVHVEPTVADFDVAAATAREEDRDAVRALLISTTREIRRLRAGGSNQAARDLARDTALGLAERLDRDRSGERGIFDDVETDPRRLAERIRR
jgi:hypothetical protein